ncbi:hypothetical protein [Pseudoxanthomonas sp. JBR18]|uniref:hypothetical protein n=1 Tax=Pseudoxanthomonas sp. JBR18 TaxID=2969308 RepID=UPI00230692F5|nr:hypothetical protein [Pseudoxanthomonas sp. JBR18]WCE03097.1 hypothetical protein PJ250_13315 [Pseudoxanthomonas sp. JBR18]
MSWLGLVMVLVFGYLAFKVAAVLLKGLFWVLVIVGLYWFASALLGLPWIF